MSFITNTLQVLISAEQLKAIWEDACELLAGVGLELDHTELRAELSQHHGVAVKGSRICFSPELAEKARGEVATDDQNYAACRITQQNFEVRPPFSPFYVIDLENGERREACEQDVADGARIYDSFGVIGPAHVHVRGLNPRSAQLRIAKLCAENSRGIGNWAPAYSYTEAVAIRDLYLAAGRAGPLVALQMVHSPLRLDRNLLDVLARARSSDNGVAGFTAGAGALPLAGVTAPIFYRAAAAQGLAECIGGWITARLIAPGIKPYASFLVWPANMATGKWAAHTPEALLFDMLNREIMKRVLGLCVYAPIGPLPQMCLYALQGCRIFEPREGHVNEAFSPAHVPLDMERLNFVARFCAGLRFEDGEPLAARLISEVLPETCFLGHESTLAYRELCWQPALLTNESPERIAEFIDRNDAKLLAQGRDIAKQRIREHAFELSAATRHEMELVFRGTAALEQSKKEAA